MTEVMRAAGATFAGYVVLRLPHGVKELFFEWLHAHYPDRRGKVEQRIRGMWGGELYDPSWHLRQRGQGPFAQQIEALFTVGCRKAGLVTTRGPLSTRAFRRPGAQRSLLDAIEQVARRDPDPAAADRGGP